MEQVRVCRVCGHINPSDDSIRCGFCWSFLAGIATIPRTEVKGPSFWLRLQLWRRRHLYLALGLVLALIAWKAAVLFDVGPLIMPPPGATTGIAAIPGPQAWPQARRDARNTGFTPDPAPIPAKIKWTFATSQALVSSPVVVDVRVYLTTEDGRTVALDRQTGKVVWEHRNGFPSSSTPAVTASLVIFAVRPGLVVALDRATGAVRWERDLENPILSSPVVVNGTVYIGAADSALHALDAATGRERWSFATEEWVISPVAHADGVVAVASQDSLLNIVGARTGRRQLLYNTGRGRRIGSGPVIQGDYVYLGTRDGRVWAIDRRARTYPFERTLLFWKVNLYVWGIISEPVQKGTVWATLVGGSIMQTPAVTPDAVYAANGQGKVTALDAATGEVRWATEVGAEITAAPTVAGGTVLAGTRDGVVVGLDGDTGEVLWDFETKGKITGSPVVAGDTMYVASHDGNLYAVTGP